MLKDASWAQYLSGGVLIDRDHDGMRHPEASILLQPLHSQIPPSFDSSAEYRTLPGAAAAGEDAKYN